MPEVEVENLDELAADYLTLRREHGLDWDLDEEFRSIGLLLDGLGESSGAESDTDLRRIRRQMNQLGRLYWILFSLFLLSVAVVIGLVIRDHFHGGQGFSFWWFVGPFLFLVPVAWVGERKRLYERADTFFENYPRQRRLLLRQAETDGSAMVHIGELWSTPGDQRRAFFHLRIFDRFKNRSQADIASARGAHQLVANLALSALPLLLHTSDAPVWHWFILSAYLVALLIGFWAMVVTDTVRELLARTGPVTLTRLVQMERESPGLPVDPEADLLVQAPEQSARAFKEQVEWLARLARRCGYRREPDYRMCVELERKARNQCHLSLILLLLTAYLLGISALAWALYPAFLGWLLFQVHRVVKLHRFRMQFEKFGRQNLSEIVLVDSDGRRVHWRNGDRQHPASRPEQPLSDALRQTGPARGGG